MIRWKKKIMKLSYLLVDGISIFLAYAVAIFLYKGLFQRPFDVNSLEMLGHLVLMGCCFIGVSLLMRLYEENRIEDAFYTLRVQLKTLAALAIATGICSTIMYLMDVPIPRVFLLIFAGCYYGFYMLSKIVLLKAMEVGFFKNKVGRHILMVGCTPNGRSYIDEIKKVEHLNFKIAGYVDINESEGYDGLKHLGHIKDLGAIAQEYRIDEIAVTQPLSYDSKLEEVLDDCQSMGVTISMLLDCHNSDDSKVHVAMVGDVPVLKFHTVSLNENQIFIKRVMDVIGALMGMALFGIAFIIFAPIIMLETPGPAIFKQLRVGKNGRTFEIWKFRSMGVNAEAQKAGLLTSNEMSGHMFKVTDDPRITRIGAFLRKTSIDELPQFYNVLRRDMSLVGTRPPTVEEVENYELHHRKRISITPGITGMWQISGRSEITDFEEVVRLDSEYITNWTVWMDLKILFKTVWVVFTKRGSK